MPTCGCRPSLSEPVPFDQKAALTSGPEGACALAWPVQASSSVVTPTAVADWRAAAHEEFWLVTNGSAALGHAGQRFTCDHGTLAFFRRGESQAFWNRSAATRLWVLKFELSPAGRQAFGELLELPPQRRVLKLSAAQQQPFCDAHLKIALEQSAERRLNAAAAAAWLTLQLVNVARWVTAGQGGPLSGCEADVDLPCFELWQAIHRHARPADAAQRPRFSEDPAYDSLRHRFQKLFGVSPRGLLVRLRMERAKELLWTTNLSVKEIAQELGYAKQHAFTRAFQRFSGMSPSEWKGKADPPCPALDFPPTASSGGPAIRLRHQGSPLPQVRIR